MSGTGAREYNFDGIVGPAHNYAGLAQGNLASQENRGLVSHPKEAALQGLEKMRLLMRLGVPQGVLPPQERPNVWVLRGMGFTGDDAAILASVAREAPEALAACGSASAMWAANAATVSPSADCADGRVHMTAANLISSMHRVIEAEQTDRTLRATFFGGSGLCIMGRSPRHRTWGMRGRRITRGCAERLESLGWRFLRWGLQVGCRRGFPRGRAEGRAKWLHGSICWSRGGRFF